MLIPWRIEEHLSSDTYQHLVRIAETLNLSEGTVLITEGDQNRTLFILESGSLNVSQETSHGVQQVGIIEPGDVTGEIAFIDQRPRSATVTVGRASQVLKLDHAKVIRAMVDSPAALADLVQALAARVTLRLRSYMTEQNIQSELSKVSAIADTPAHMDRTGKSYLGGLVQEAFSHPAVCHPYLTDLAEGNLPDLKWALRDFAHQYPGYSAHFPRFLTMVISKLDSPEESSPFLVETLRGS